MATQNINVEELEKEFGTDEINIEDTEFKEEDGRGELKEADE